MARLVLGISHRQAGSRCGLTANITSSMIPGAGSFKVVVQTPAGNTDDLGCSSGGTSSAQILTVN